MAHHPIQKLDDFDRNSPLIKEVLQRTFPMAHIVTERALGDRIRLKLVGREFNGLSEDDKQEKVWTALKDAFKEGSMAVRWVVVYGDDEL